MLFTEKQAERLRSVKRKAEEQAIRECTKRRRDLEERRWLREQLSVTDVL